MKLTDVWSIAPLADEKAILRGNGWRITVLTDRLFRLEQDEQERFRDTASQTVLCRRFPLPAFTVDDTGDTLIVETEDARLVYDKKPFSSAGLSVTLKGAYSVYASIWHYGDAADTLKGTARTLDQADGAIPLGEGLMSVKGYSVLDDGDSMGMDEKGNLLPAREHGTDLYLFAYGHDFRGCLRDYLKLTGPIAAVPRFALGNWWSRFYPYTQDGYRELMEQFEAEQVPLSVSVLDMNWHITDIDPKYGVGWTGYSWDREKFPEPEALLAWLHEHKLAVTLNDHPADGVRACEEMYPQMAAAMGEDPAKEIPFPYDAADEKYRRAFESAVLTPYEEMGVDFWWIDWQQQGGSSDPGMDPLFTLNHTRYEHALEGGTPGIVLSRYAGPGSHRYPIGFSGDTYATWDSLDFQPYFTAAAANIAYTWWSHDIGGHMRGYTDYELTNRWYQFGVFSPVMRLHSSTSLFRKKEPWNYPAETEAVMKRYLRLRHRLIPWLYTQNLKANREYAALLRPVYYDYPEDRALYLDYRNEYLFGDSMLVCPVTKPADPLTGLAETESYIPEGIWTDFFTGERCCGRRVLKLYRDMQNIPVLVKEGSVIPMDACEFPGNGVDLPETVLLRVFPGKDCRTELLEDNGKPEQDPDCRSAVTGIRLTQEDGNGLTLEVLPAEGDRSVLPENRSYVVELNGFADVLPDEADCEVTSSYDAAGRALTLTLSGTDAVRDGIRLHWSQVPEVPQFDFSDALYKLLDPVRMDFDRKDMIMQLALNGNLSREEFLAFLNSIELPASLVGAILEIASVR